MNRSHIEALLVGLLIGGVLVPLSRALQIFPKGWSTDALGIGITTAASVLLARYLMVVIGPRLSRFWTKRRA